MRKQLIAMLLSAACAASALAGYVQHVPVDVSDARQNFPLRVARGEVVELSVDYFDEGEPLDISGSEVVLHTRTNGMAAAESWQTPGMVSSNSALFTLDVDAVMPFASGTWSIDFTRGGEKVTRPGGQAWVRGTAAGSIAADPVQALSGYATTGYVARAVADAEPGDYPAVSNAAMRAVQVETDPTVPAWAKSAQPPAVVETDPVFVAVSNRFIVAEADPVWLSQRADYATIGAVAQVAAGLAGKANDSAVVHKTGDEAIAGDKVFTGGVEFYLGGNYAAAVFPRLVGDMAGFMIATGPDGYEIAFPYASGTLALTSDIPTVPSWAKAQTKPTYTASEVGATTPEDVTAAIREQSLGGIWDEDLQIWWTPHMANGSLTYMATTNVNLNAGN